MAKKRSPDRRPTKDVKKALSLKKGPIDGKGGKSAGPAKSSSKRLTSPAIESQPAEQDRSKEKTFLIVGIGASAGGLEACTKLLEHLPPHTGMAFVLVQHLAPAKDSILAELLSKATSMPVREVQDGMIVEPDHVYVIPPNTVLAVFHGKLRLLPRAEPHTQHMPVDSFFRSLAEDQGSECRRYHPFRDRLRRFSGYPGHKGRGRDRPGPGRTIGKIQRHAQERRCDRGRGFHPAP